MISCDKHDFVEIACMYKLEVALEAKTGKVIYGIANDILLNNMREECIKVHKKDNTYAIIALSKILSMRAMVANPHFDIITFD